MPSKLITPELIATSTPSAAPQKLDATYSLAHSKVISDDDDREFFESYSHVLINERHGTITRELVQPVVRDGKTEFYGRVRMRDQIPRFKELEKLEEFHKYLALIRNFDTLDSHGGFSSVQATKSWSGFVVESNSFRVLWVTLEVSIEPEDDQWSIHDRRIVELVYSRDSSISGNR